MTVTPCDGGGWDGLRSDRLLAEGRSRSKIKIKIKIRNRKPPP